MAAFSSPAFSVQRTAKFWFANGLGSLQVYPSLLATLALDDAIRQKRQRWVSNTKSLAYILPITSITKGTKVGLKTYGSRRARSIFQGGGPMILEDSPDLATQALHKLGYLDHSWNTDK